MRVNKKNGSSVPARKSRAKAPGTRLGTIEDWRGDSGKTGNMRKERRNAFRDGR